MAFNKTKTDPELGQEIHEHLVKMGVETPQNENSLSRTEKIELISKNFQDTMKVLGLNLKAFLDTNSTWKQFFQKND